MSVTRSAISFSISVSRLTRESRPHYRVTGFHLICFRRFSEGPTCFASAALLRHFGIGFDVALTGAVQQFSLQPGTIRFELSHQDEQVVVHGSLLLRCA